MEDIDSVFQRFRDKSTDFARDVSQLLYSQSRVTPSIAAQVNLTLAKTVFSKWSIEILTVLYSVRAVSYGDLKRGLRGITSKVLSEKLKKLEDGELVQRSVVSSRPPRTMYSLTEKGFMVAKLGEPVFLYMGYKEGLFDPPKLVLEKNTW